MYVCTHTHTHTPIQVGAADTRTPERGDQVPGTTLQTRAAAEADNMKNNMSFIYVNNIQNHTCYKNVNHMYVCIHTHTHTHTHTLCK